MALEKNFIQLKTDFEIPPRLQEAIDALQKGVEEGVSYVDCLQDEVHSCVRDLDDEEREQIILDYYVRRRW